MSTSPAEKQPELRRSKRKAIVEVDQTDTSSITSSNTYSSSSASASAASSSNCNDVAFQPQTDPLDKMVQDIIDYVLNDMTFKIGPQKKVKNKKSTAENPKKKRRTQAEMMADRLIEIGDKPIDRAGNCARAAIFKGFIKMNWEPSDLDQIIVTEPLILCNHTRAVTLRELLRQPDYAGIDYMTQEDATVRCKENGCDSAVYVMGVCNGRPRFDDGQAHNHCNKCKNFGECLWDYGEDHCDDCGRHFFGGFVNDYKCECKETLEEKQRNQVMKRVKDRNINLWLTNKEGFNLHYDLEERLLNSPYWNAGLDSETDCQDDWMGGTFKLRYADKYV